MNLDDALASLLDQWIETSLEAGHVGALAKAENARPHLQLLLEDNSVALLVFWLALLFASFGLFAPPNWTCVVTLTLCALAVAGAVAMFLELEQGVGGVVRISP